MSSAEITKMIFPSVLCIFLVWLKETVADDCYGSLISAISKANESLMADSDKLESLVALHRDFNERHFFDAGDVYGAQFSEIFFVDAKKFMLSRTQTHNYDFAASVCALYGGYLAEIETEADLTYIGSVVSKHGDVQNLWVGANDREVETKFVYTNSGRPAFTKFAPNQARFPNTAENCVMLRRKRSWLMIDASCILNYPLSHFLCQVS